MKKNMLFSIALCIGLMLPGISFGSEPTQSAYDWNWIKEKINSWYNSYMPQVKALSEEEMNAQKIQTYALLGTMGMLGLGYLAYLQKDSKRKNIKKDDPIQAKIATNVYGMLPVDLTNTYGDNNIKNIAQFLSNEEWKNWDQLQNQQNNQDAKWNAQWAEFNTPSYVFNAYVLPVLNQLIPTLPNQPQALIDYDNLKLEERMELLDQVRNRPDIKKYYLNTFNFWNNFVTYIIQNAMIKINLSNDNCLQTIHSYLPENTPLKTSIENALSGQLGRSSRTAYPWNQKENN